MTNGREEEELTCSSWAVFLSGDDSASSADCACSAAAFSLAAVISAIRLSRVLSFLRESINSFCKSSREALATDGGSAVLRSYRHHSNMMKAALESAPPFVPERAVSEGTQHARGMLHTATGKLVRRIHNRSVRFAVTRPYIFHLQGNMQVKLTSRHMLPAKHSSKGNIRKGKKQ
jgi:hypothetical protein